jgi:phospholipid/cholesterol/gamma-HCH transport system substrate-binding protein
MDQSKSSSIGAVTAPTGEIQLPKRSFSIEFFVGFFTLLSVAAVGYLAIGLGELRLFDTGRYTIYAEFDNISGLQHGASVEIAGVPIGSVTKIDLKDPVARVTLELITAVQIRDDDIASIRTKGIIGDRYVKISRGASDILIPPGGTITETESVVDIEDVIGKFVHSLGGDKDEDKKAEAQSE